MHTISESSFSFIFREEFVDLYFEIECVIGSVYTDLHIYGMHSERDYNFKTKDAFDLLVHRAFLSLCNTIIDINKAGRKVIFVLIDHESTDSDHHHSIMRVAQLAVKVLPVLHIATTLSLVEFEQAIMDRDVSVLTDYERVVHKMNKSTFKPFNLNKLIKYLDKRGLRYLSSKYFQQVNSKLLAANK